MYLSSLLIKWFNVLKLCQYVSWGSESSRYHFAPRRGVIGAFPALPPTLDHQLPEASSFFFSLRPSWLAPGLVLDRSVHGDEWEGNFSERQSSEVPSPLGGYLLCSLASHTLFSGLSFLFLVNFKEKVDLSKTAHCWLNVNKRYMNRGCRGRESSGNIWSKMTNGGFLGFSVVKNLPGNAGDAGLIPGPGRSHMAWTDSQCAATAEPASCNYWALSPCGWGSATRAATAARSPHITATDQPEPAETRDKPTRHPRPSTTKNNK